MTLTALTVLHSITIRTKKHSGFCSFAQREKVHFSVIERRKKCILE